MTDPKSYEPEKLTSGVTWMLKNSVCTKTPAMIAVSIRGNFGNLKVTKGNTGINGSMPGEQ